MIFCWSLYVLCFAFLNAWISERNLWCPIGHSSERQFRFVISYIVSYSQSFSYSDDVLDKKYRFYLFLFLLIPGLRRSFVSIQPAYSIASIFLFFLWYRSIPFLKESTPTLPLSCIDWKYLFIAFQHLVSIIGFHFPLQSYGNSMGVSIMHSNTDMVGYTYFNFLIPFLLRWITFREYLAMISFCLFKIFSCRLLKLNLSQLVKRPWCWSTLWYYWSANLSPRCYDM